MCVRAVVSLVDMIRHSLGVHHTLPDRLSTMRSWVRAVLDEREKVRLSKVAVGLCVYVLHTHAHACRHTDVRPGFSPGIWSDKQCGASHRLHGLSIHPTYPYTHAHCALVSWLCQICCPGRYDLWRGFSQATISSLSKDPPMLCKDILTLASERF